MLLLDEMVFESKGLFVVGYNDIVNIHRFPQQGASLGVRNPALMEIGADPVTQAFRLANVDHLTFGIFVQIHAG